MTSVYLLILALLLALNAFFVVAEFAAVRVRGTQISELEAQGRIGATILRHIHSHLDEYLSVCQLGITFTSVGLGFVGEPAIATLLEPLLGSKTAAHAISISISYVLVSALHIVLGEQVPKIAAISFPVQCAMLVAWPMRWAHKIFYLPLMALNGIVRLILRPFGVREVPGEAAPSEAEVRIILEKSQQEGMMPFRRLLLLENVFDFGNVRVKDEMRSLDQIVALYADRPWDENRNKILATNHTRYPLFEGTPPKPLGIVHIKDLLNPSTSWPDEMNLKTYARRMYLTSPDTPLEQLMTDLRRRRMQMALVNDASGKLCGLITMEDILEQLVGAIEDEFETEMPLRLGDVLSESRVLMNLDSETADAAISEIIRRCPTEDVALPKEIIIEAVLARERSLPTYLGENLAVPHARLDNIKNAFVFFARSEKGVVFDAKRPDEKARVLFLLLTPASLPRLQTQLLARIANLRESNYVWDRLFESKSSTEAIEAIRSGDELLTT